MSRQPYKPVPGFQSGMNKGFRITFDNGWSVSVQWGIVNYCEHRDSGYRLGSEAKQDVWASCNAEVAIIDPQGVWQKTEGHGEVIGWCTPDQVAAIIAATASVLPKQVTKPEAVRAVDLAMKHITTKEGREK